VVGRRLLVILLAVSGAACGTVDEVEDALSPSDSPQTSPSVTGSPSASDAGGRPAIVVRTPAPGDELVSPVTIAGTADVFEATVSIRILDANGQELAATFATATCGSGCRGRYSTDLSFLTTVRQPGTIEVFESSAEDGSVINLVSIPVVLVPGS
jgi:Immunoglobulin-like domain of bacterial spore germination